MTNGTGRTIGALAIAAALTVTGAACGGNTDVAGDPSDEVSAQAGYRNVVRTEPFDVGSASLPEVTEDNEGEFSFRAESGELLFVFFGYTHCPDVCPTTLSFYKAAIEGLPEDDLDKVSLAMVTIDPERDTAEVLNEHLSFYADSYHAVRTADYDELLEVEALFGTSSSVGTTPEGKPDVEHSGTAYLVDDQGVVLVEFPFGVSTADLAHDLALAIEDLSDG